MFRKNTGYLQQGIFDENQNLTKQKQKLWDKSKEHLFFKTVFKRIDENRFSILYSKVKSRPNTPVNQLVGSLVLKHLYDWTYEELFLHLNFNLLTRHAIGIHDLQQNIFSPASLFNFQNKVTEYFKETGEDLFMEIFNSLTTDQIDEFNVSTKIQRGDSFLMGSNIVNYTRITLLVEVLLRVYRTLSEADKKEVYPILDKYTKQTANQYTFKLKKENIPYELSKLAEIYHQLFVKFKLSYEDDKVFKMFERVYKENFKLEEKQIIVTPSKELGSNKLMSPDDEQATFRTKRNEIAKGFTGHISETASPDNELNLITDLEVVPNNVDDAKILEKRMPEMLKKTPDLAEYHADGLYGNEEVDKIMDKNGIKQVQANIRGNKSNSGIRIHSPKQEGPFVKCNGGQQVPLINTGKTWKAEFDYSICSQCPFKDNCNTKITGTKSGNPRRYKVFYDKSILAHSRFNNIDKLPPERRKLRANIEATIKETKRGMKNNKLRVRGLTKAKDYLIWTSIAINLTRIHRCLSETPVFFLKTILTAIIIDCVSKLTNVKSENLKLIIKQPCSATSLLAR